MKLFERIHRLWYRRWYAKLPEFFREFYPFERALSLCISNAEHDMRTAKSMDELARISINRAVALERKITELRLTMHCMEIDPTERDRFMATWFGRSKEKAE